VGAAPGDESPEGRVKFAEIWRHPVKSMAGERLVTVAQTRSPGRIVDGVSVRRVR
jgi:hypothetical protein